MIKNKILYMLLLISLLGLTPLYAGGFNSGLDKRGKIDLIFYGGKWTESGLTNIILKQETDYKDSYIAVGAFNYLMEAKINKINFESEGQVVKHFGMMKHFELNGLMIARISNVIPGLPISFAFGEGVSYATTTPELETKKVDFMKLQFEKQKSRPFLNYLLVEVDYAVKSLPYQPRVFMRIHHRSGIYGTYCPPICGSNFVSYGLKFSL